MSWNPSLAPICPDEVGADAIETLIIPRARDVAGFEVRRALPAPRRQLVGPFIFFDQMGPSEFLTGAGIDIRPHPHIGLGTVTWLLQGDIHHRDSIGSDQVIRPGAVNWMVAGRGVSHSERTSCSARRGPHSLFGVQTWIALPEAQEEIDPFFEHHPAEALPTFRDGGIEARLIMGSAYGAQAPARLFGETFYLDVTLSPDALFPLPDDHEDRAIHLLKGEITVAGERFAAGQMLVFRPGDAVTVAAGPQGARLVALGGATLGEPRYVWWNFVSSSRERIEEARHHWQAADWGKGMFDLPPGDDREFIPLPEPRRPPRNG